MMGGSKVTEKDLRQQLESFREEFPKLKDDDLFILWFLLAYVTEDEQRAAEALCGGPHEKDVDAIFIDDPSRAVVIVQGKYRRGIAKGNEHRQDVLQFARMADEVYATDVEFSAFAKDLAPIVHEKLTQARDRVLKRKYRLMLYYVTTGKCSSSTRKEAGRIAGRPGGSRGIDIIDGARILLVLADYLDGVAPPIPSLDLEIDSGRGAGGSAVLQRYDKDTDIESWVFSVKDRTVADLYERAKSRLFARNVRGYLGSTEINDDMEETLSSEPEYFWYYNNGISLICDGAEKISSRGREILRVANPQVINGQQTTRTLSRAKTPHGASVLVRVIRVPRGVQESNGRYDLFVSKIVSATNKQNAIGAPDLMSNDRRQVEIGRQFRKLGYWYIRKRQTKSEAKRSAGAGYRHMIRKEELAQAVAGCELDPAVVRAGKSKLFEEHWYPMIFPTADPLYYLTRYWLMKEVGYAASGYPERAYAKWLVLNFVHSRVAPLLRSRATAEALGRAWRRNIAPIGALNRSVHAVFKASLQFYRARRGKGAKALDVSRFFRRRGLHREFSRFWQSSSNRSRSAFRRAWTQFERELAHEAAR